MIGAALLDAGTSETTSQFGKSPVGSTFPATQLAVTSDPMSANPLIQRGVRQARLMTSQPGFPPGSVQKC